MRAACCRGLRKCQVKAAVRTCILRPNKIPLLADSIIVVYRKGCRACTVVFHRDITAYRFLSRQRSRIFYRHVGCEITRIHFIRVLQYQGFLVRQNELVLPCRCGFFNLFNADDVFDFVALYPVAVLQDVFICLDRIQHQLHAAFAEVRAFHRVRKLEHVTAWCEILCAWVDAKGVIGLMGFFIIIAGLFQKLLFRARDGHAGRCGCTVPCGSIRIGFFLESTLVPGCRIIQLERIADLHIMIRCFL